MKKGFTMIEILISIAIIAVLTAIGIVSYVNINKNARDAKRRGDIEQIRSALELYRSDKGYYPAVGTGSWTAASTLNTGDPDTGLVDTYLPIIPSDPKGATRPYMYQSTNVSATTGQYYGYCLSANLEGVNSSSCTPYTDYTYGTKNP
jgi:general secretion pathway protein G